MHKRGRRRQEIEDRGLEADANPGADRCNPLGLLTVVPAVAVGGEWCSLSGLFLEMIRLKRWVRVSVRQPRIGGKRGDWDPASPKSKSKSRYHRLLALVAHKP